MAGVSSLRGVDFQGLALLAVLAVGGFVVWRAVRAAPAAAEAVREAASQVGTAVNPADPGNVVNRAVTSAGQAATGDASWTLGGWLAEVFDPRVRAANDMLSAPLPGAGGPPPGWQGAGPVDRVRGGW